MSPKKTATKSKKTKKVTIAQKLSPDAFIQYSNFISVNVTDYDFRLNFMEFNPAKEKVGDTVQLDIDTQVIIPLNLAKGLIRALEQQIELYEKKGTKIPDAKEVKH